MIHSISKAQSVKERPILFSGEMVRSILDGRKTQTRRIVKPNLIVENGWVFKHPNHARLGKYIGGIVRVKCPHGQPGDHLYVRETFAVIDREGFANEKPDSVIYACDPSTSPHLHFRPSIHMHRWASRITLEIVSVKVERLNEISESDAIAEGLYADGFAAGVCHPHAQENCRRCGFKTLWESINGPGSWAANPFVWAITFRKL